MWEANPDELIDKKKHDILKNKYHQNNIIPYIGTYYFIAPSSEIHVDGHLRLNANCVGENGRVTNLRMDENSKLKVKGNFDIYYGGDIICFKNSELVLGSGFCNSNLILRCTKRIVIGDGAAISHNVTIMDSDAHEIIGNSRDKTQPVMIGDHVWIGSGAKILKGVTIGNGAVVGAGAVVVHDVPANCAVAGAPAAVIKRGISWKV